MTRLFLVTILSIFLVACSHLHVYQPDVQQGNVITQAKVQKLHKGMTKAQAEKTMGQPILKNVFDPGKLFYVYTFKPNYGKKIQKHVILSFKNHRLIKIQQF